MQYVEHKARTYFYAVIFRPNIALCPIVTLHNYSKDSMPYLTAQYTLPLSLWRAHW